ncbi:DUF488 domain-containing protein [Acidicapsa ligni]|uniref:DUF488 domain-containing protein n=1 Tax=Acidicapsa ligni TaxID=542300 RepID=UPI0021E08FE0|nr:DUF488 domain-containing protein [Acidicapsa ligni]
MHVQIKRVYEEPGEADGIRILVDRLWPRGLTKAKAAVDIWMKEIAPSNELRKWFAHDPVKWEEFRTRYIDELKKNSQQVLLLRQQVEKGTTTLLYGARDEEHNEAVVLQQLLRK